jgi:hypothetical protein
LRVDDALDMMHCDMRHSSGCECDVSVIVPFGDDEDRVGAMVRSVAAHLRSFGARFEIIAANEDSSDNSHALLALLHDRGVVPELQVVLAARDLGFAAGARVARGRTLWLLDVDAAGRPFAPFWWAQGRVAAGEVDALVVPGRFIVCRRTQAWRVLEETRGRGLVYERKFVKRGQQRGLRIETPGGPSMTSTSALHRVAAMLRRA